MLNLLLLCNLNFMSSMILAWLCFGYQTGLQVFDVTPALPYWYIVVSSVFQLFSFLDRSSLIPTMPTKFHHHLQAWIHSTPVNPGSRPLPPHFEGTTNHGFHPQYPLSPYQDQGSFITQTTQRPYTKFMLHCPQSNYQGPHCMHAIPANMFHRTKFKPNSSSNTASSKKANR